MAGAVCHGLYVSFLSFSPYVYDCLLHLSYLFELVLLLVCARMYAFVAFSGVSGSNIVSEHLLCTSWGTCAESDCPLSLSLSTCLCCPLVSVCPSCLCVSGLSHLSQGA